MAAGPEFAPPDWLGDWEYAHRGLHGSGRPENSMAAFAAAFDAGMGVECDVRLSADGIAMVFHDETLERLAGEAAGLRQKSAEELERVAIGGTDETIPRLDALLGLAAGRFPVLVEIKTSAERPVNRLCRAVARSLEGHAGLAAIMGFDPRVPRWFAERAPAVPRGLVVTEEGRRTFVAGIKRRMTLGASRAQFLAYDIRDLPSRSAARARAAGLPVLTWTVKTPDQRAVAAEHADAPIAEGAGIAMV